MEKRIKEWLKSDETTLECDVSCFNPKSTSRRMLVLVKVAFALDLTGIWTMIKPDSDVLSSDSLDTLLCMEGMYNRSDGHVYNLMGTLAQLMPEEAKQYGRAALLNRFGDEVSAEIVKRVEQNWRIEELDEEQMQTCLYDARRYYISDGLLSLPIPFAYAEFHSRTYAPLSYFTDSKKCVDDAATQFLSDKRNTERILRRLSGWKVNNKVLENVANDVAHPWHAYRRAVIAIKDSGAKTVILEGVKNGKPFNVKALAFAVTSSFITGHDIFGQYITGLNDSLPIDAITRISYRGKPLYIATKEGGQPE